MPRRVEPDDDVFRWRSVWLGPQGASTPWTARYAAYGTGIVIFVAILLIEAVTPIPTGVPPTWEFVITVLATTLLMQAVDHDKAVTPVVLNVYRSLRQPRAPRPDTTTYVFRDRRIPRHTNRDPNEPHHHVSRSA